MKSQTPDDPVLADLLETASALEGHQLMPRADVEHIRALWAASRAFPPERVIAIRTKIAGMSQQAFASLLRVKLSTVQQWESPQAAQPPGEAAARLLHMIETHGVQALASSG